MPLSKWEYGTAGTARCMLCGADNSVYAFPAILAAAAATRPESAMEGEAACFDHPNKRAAAACSQCGRYVCGLCSVEFGPEIWCPSCVATRAGGARAANLDTSRTLFDSVALTLPLVTLLMWPFTIVAAPASLVIGIAKWRYPLSLVRRNRWRLVVAMMISVAEIVAWVWGIAYYLTRPVIRGT